MKLMQMISTKIGRQAEIASHAVAPPTGFRTDQTLTAELTREVFYYSLSLSLILVLQLIQQLRVHQPTSKKKG